jgi:hypothetical protein
MKTNLFSINLLSIALLLVSTGCSSNKEGTIIPKIYNNVGSEEAFCETFSYFSSSASKQDVIVPITNLKKNIVKSQEDLVILDNKIFRFKFNQNSPYAGIIKPTNQENFAKTSFCTILNNVKSYDNQPNTNTPYFQYDKGKLTFDKTIKSRVFIGINTENQKDGAYNLREVKVDKEYSMTNQDFQVFVVNEIKY